jgi:acylphosphatase
MKKQAYIRFTGTVQGVGFRYTTLHTAIRLGLTGWVKNMEDGSVEVVAEGEEDIIVQLISRLNERFEGYIKNTETQWSEPTNEFATFEVGY